MGVSSNKFMHYSTAETEGGHWFSQPWWPVLIGTSYNFSIMNSLVIVLFLSGMVAMIMLRTLHRDIARYNQMDNSVSLCLLCNTCTSHILVSLLWYTVPWNRWKCMSAEFSVIAKNESIKVCDLLLFQYRLVISTCRWSEHVNFLFSGTILRNLTLTVS